MKNNSMKQWLREIGENRASRWDGNETKSSNPPLDNAPIEAIAWNLYKSGAAFKMTQDGLRLVGTSNKRIEDAISLNQDRMLRLLQTLERIRRACAGLPMFELDEQEKQHMSDVASIIGVTLSWMRVPLTEAVVS